MVPRLFVLLLFFTLVPSSVTTAQDTPVRRIALPAPWGEYGVGVYSTVVVDSARRARTDDGRLVPRPLLVRLWHPADSAATGTRAYMHPALAEAWRATLPVPPDWEQAVAANAVDGAPLARNGGVRWPVLLFSHGRSWPVENYQILLEHLASLGWIVAAISHPGEEILTRLPDGTRIPYAGPGWETEEERGVVLQSVVDQHVIDGGMVLDWLERVNNAPDGPFSGRLDLEGGVGYFGHSLGGASAAWTLQRDDRVVAAASWEGQVYRAEDRPLTVVGPLMYVIGGANRAELAGVHFRGGGIDRPVYEVVIHGAWHSSPGDLLYLYRRYAPRDWKERHRREISPVRALQITGDYLHAFFARYLRGAESNVLDPDAPDEGSQDWNYPEVELRKHFGDGGYWSAQARTP